jgi:hypothetical protein
MLTALRRASSRVRRCAAAASAGFVLAIDVCERLPVGGADDEAGVGLDRRAMAAGSGAETAWVNHETP